MTKPSKYSVEHEGRAERNRQAIQSNRTVQPDVNIYHDGSGYGKDVAR